MARTQAADYEDQRSAILEAAASAFAETGYASCTMATLATRCGTSKARLYHYYASKDAILYDLLERHTGSLLAIVAQVHADCTARNASPRERLESLIRRFLDAYRTARTRHIALTHDVKFLPAERRDVIVAREREVIDSFAAAIEAAFPARVTPANLRALTMMLMGAMNWTFTWLKPDGALSYADFADQVIDVLLAGLAAQESRGVESRSCLRAA
ncbi:MAG: TetR family transcriptional regulator [Burkholderiales bacterium]|nr:TetR family transcriptional regulator [Burkholderiales bacterium]